MRNDLEKHQLQCSTALYSTVKYCTIQYSVCSHSAGHRGQLLLQGAAGEGARLLHCTAQPYITELCPSFLPMRPVLMTPAPPFHANVWPGLKQEVDNFPPKQSWICTIETKSSVAVNLKSRCRPNHIKITWYCWHLQAMDFLWVKPCYGNLFEIFWCQYF